MSDPSQAKTRKFGLLRRLVRVSRIPQLFVVRGPGVGDVYCLSRCVTIVGRERDADLALAHRSVSRRHAQLTVDGERLWIEDLGSTNGTLVRGEGIRGRTLLRDSDSIGVGAVTFLKLSYAPDFGEILRRAAYRRRTRDAATRVGNREYLVDRFAAEYAYARRHGSPLTLVFIRSDDAREIQPPESPLVDDIMGLLATIVHETTRAEEVVARSGADELVIIARGTPAEAMVLARRVRARIADRGAVATRVSPPLTVTIAVVAVGAGEPRPSRAAATIAAAEAVLTVAEVAALKAMADARDQVVMLAAPAGTQ